MFSESIYFTQNTTTVFLYFLEELTVFLFSLADQAASGLSLWIIYVGIGKGKRIIGKARNYFQGNIYMFWILTQKNFKIQQFSQICRDDI